MEVQLGGSGKEEEPVRCADAGVRPGDQAEAASRRVEDGG